MDMTLGARIGAMVRVLPCTALVAGTVVLALVSLLMGAERRAYAVSVISRMLAAATAISSGSGATRRVR